MAGDWIKMRASLMTHPKVIAIAKAMERSTLVSQKLSTGYNGALRDVVTRDVTRDVTLASLFRIWCAANEHTSDGTWYGIEIEDLDHVAGVPGFGLMMESVGWAVSDTENDSVNFPNFLEYNAPAKNGRGNNPAERQRKYREKKRQNVTESDVTRYVTRDVTRVTKSDVEKRREEKRRINKKSNRKSTVVEKPDSVSSEVWDAHLTIRKAKRQPMTPLALKQMQADAESVGLSLESALSISVKRGWASFDSSWLKPDDISKATENKSSKRRMMSKHWWTLVGGWNASLTESRLNELLKQFPKDPEDYPEEFPQFFGATNGKP